jgi:DNA polymerase-3 subunit alpha
LSFVNLHVHSAQGSLLDSILTTKQIVDYAKRNNQYAVALSDHGTMHASLNLVNDCQKAGIKPITACEIYECDNHLEHNSEDKYNHLLLIAKTTDGLHNLYKIVSEGYVNGFYRKPRVSVQWIKDNKLGEGIICLTACQAGRISRCLEVEEYQEAENFINLLKNTFDYVALEIQSHPTEVQLKMNTLIVSFANRVGLNYVITSDAHMEKADQIDTHSIFVGISQDREVGETYIGCHLQNENDIFNYLGGWNSKEIIQKGINETIHIANMVDDDIDYELNKGVVMPPAHIPEGYDVESYFRHLVYSTFEEKFGYMTEKEQKIRRDRIEEEIPVLKELDFLNYLLIQHEFCNECDKRGIPRGYSRGSAANCLCVFMLGITQIDSVRWDLDFSRFANIGRKGSIADIDLDISKSRRQEAIQVLCDIFGADHVAPMATFNTLSTKVAIKDIAKVLNEKEGSPYFGQIPYSIRDEIAKMIPTVKTLNDLGEEEEKETLLKDLVGKNEKLDKYYKQFPLLFKYVMELEGLPKSRGRHASGTLLTPKPIIHYSPLCLDNDKNVMSMFDMHICQDTKGGMGLTKEDLLGLETLDTIDMALKNAGITWKDVDINHINLDDERVYNEVYKTGDTINVFQMESFDARKMLIDAQASNIEDVVVVNAANRPGTKDSFPDYCKNKLHPDKAIVIHPDLKKLFAQSQNVLMYQEQALSLLRYAGFPEEEVENGRRAIGKKIPEEMKKLKPKFESGLKKKDWGDEQIEAIWNLLLKQSSYCFNR